MKKFLVTALFLLGLSNINVVAQDAIQVVEPLKLINDAYASTHPVYVNDGKVCSVIKVGIKVPDIEFKGTYFVKQLEWTNNEYIVYVAPGCKKITIYSGVTLPFEYEFKEYPEGLASAATYRLLLSIPESAVSESLVRIRTNVKQATLTLAGQSYTTDDGRFEVKIPKGEYDYEISTNLSGFNSAKGKLLIDDIAVRKRIELTTERKYSLSIQADDNAKITIDGIVQPKRGSHNVDLSAGLHTVQAVLESGGQIWEKSPVDIDMTSGNANIDMTMRGNLRIIYPTNARFEIIPQQGALPVGQKYIQAGETISLLGNYVIKVTKKNYMDNRVRVEVNVDDNIDNFKIDVTSQADNYFYGTNGKKQNFIKAFKEYEKMANKGDEIAQYKTGICLEEGKGTLKNEYKAQEYYKKASNAGIAEATYALANMLNKKDAAGKRVAEKYYVKAADQGISESATIAGINFAGDRDYKNAMKYSLMGADDKSNKWRSYSMEIIGSLYFDGLGVEKNLSKARSWFNEAAALGNNSAFERLIDYVYSGYDGKPDKAAAIRAYMKLDNISPKACVRVALYHFEKQNYNLASYYFMRVRDKNVALPGDIGEIFYTIGNEVYDKDASASYYFYSTAYNKGIQKPLQMVRLGFMNLNGKGTVINHTKAKEFFEKASNLNDNEGTFMLATMYEKGRGCTINQAVAMSLYERAGKKGYMRAYLNLGTLYATKKDMNNAVKYWEIAAKSGNQTAIKNLVKYYKSKKNSQKEKYWNSKLK